MQTKLKAIYNKIRTQYNHTNLCASIECVKNNINKVAEKLAKMGVSANAISVAGFVVGMMTPNFLAMNMYGWALFCILFNRLCDALDGAVAKIKGISNFGIFLDACLDYVFYAAVIFGFALAVPHNYAVAASFLLFAFASSACAMLAYAVVAYKQTELKESPFYLGGFAQGAETITAFVILCIVPVWFVPVAIILGCWCLIKAMLVVSTAYYTFVVSAKDKK